MICRVCNQHLLWQTEEKLENLVRMICDAAESLPNSLYPYRCINLFGVVLSYKAHCSLLLCTYQFNSYVVLYP